MIKSVLPVRKRLQEIEELFSIAEKHEIIRDFDRKEIQSIDINGLKFISKVEGFRREPYLDTGGVPTIGFGFTYYTNGQEVTMDDKPISKFEARQMIKEIVMPYSETVRKYVTSDINQNQFNALVSFTYNVGIRGFENSTLLEVINENPNNESAIKAQFRRWKYDNGSVVKGLINRREKEINLYFK